MNIIIFFEDIDVYLQLLEKDFCLQKARGKWFFLLQPLFLQIYLFKGIFE